MCLCLGVPLAAEASAHTPEQRHVKKTGLRAPSAPEGVGDLLWAHRGEHTAFPALSYACHPSEERRG